jgi:hypothetical protein
MAQGHPEVLGVNNARPQNAMRCWTMLAAVSTAFAFCVPPMLKAQSTNTGGSSEFVVRQFILPEYYEEPGTNRGQTKLLKALVTGKEAVPQGRELMRVQQMRMEHFALDGRTNLIARAPHCIVDPGRHEVYSDGPLEAEGNGGTLFIEGQGFFCQLTNLHLILSNRVRTIIRHDANPPLKP